jgi:hypothetical protein
MAESAVRVSWLLPNKLHSATGWARLDSICGALTFRSICEMLHTRWLPATYVYSGRLPRWRSSDRVPWPGSLCVCCYLQRRFVIAEFSTLYRGFTPLSLNHFLFKHPFPLSNIFHLSTHSPLLILWCIDLLLGNDRETNETAAVARRWPARQWTRWKSVFSAQSAHATEERCFLRGPCREFVRGTKFRT